MTSNEVGQFAGRGAQRGQARRLSYPADGYEPLSAKAETPPGRESGGKRLHLRLRPAVEARIRAGHPWVFADSIREQNRPGVRGELGVIFDRSNRFLAAGLYDPDSPIRLRILQCGTPVAINADWWEARLSEALEKRRGLLDETTNAARLIHGENDRFPGLVLDQYARTLVLKIYSGAWFGLLPMILDAIKLAVAPERLILRLSRNIQSAGSAAGWRDAQALLGAAPDGPVPFLESGLRFEADVLQGQKTGFFLDQRENRRHVETLARGKDVLNAFSFSGAFSLYAARGGARSVTDLDISAHALESSKRNAALNPGLGAANRTWQQADVFDWLAARRTERFGLVILDPPSLAKRESERPGALRAYARLAESGAALTEPGGTLVCCSCSAHVRAEEFHEVVLEAAARTGRTIAVLRRTGQPQDHPATFPEAEYLKAIYLRIGGRTNEAAAKGARTRPASHSKKPPEKRRLADES